jgi:uncharacterized protein with GYD domain
MATYVMMARWTDKGIENVKDSPARFEAFKKTAVALGGEVRELFVALGRYDTLSLVSAPDDETMAKISLSLCAQGNVHTETLRVFSEGEYKKLLSGLR